MVIDILDRSTLVPFPHPGFFLFSRFCKPKRRMNTDEHRVNDMLKIYMVRLMSVHFCPFVPTSLLRCVRSSLLHQCLSPCALLSLEDELFQMRVQLDVQFRNADISLCQQVKLHMHLSLQKPL